MSTPPDFWLDNPPVWELGLTVQTEASGLVSAYDIKSAHDLFREQYPNVSRHEPVDMQASSPRELTPTDPLVRWWFTSPDQHYLVQLQENLIAFNWRRLIMPPSKVDYPGYTRMRDGFRKIQTDLQGLAGDAPAPKMAEIAYDNFLPLPGTDGSVGSMSDLLVILARPFQPPVSGFQMAWFENHGTAETPILLRVQIAHVLVGGEGGQVTPSLRLNLNCRRDLSRWDEVYEFFDAAHALTRQRFLELTTERAHTIWGLR